MSKTYDAKDCTVVVDGVYITGFGEDMVSFEKDEEFISSTVGAQGDIITNAINNDLYTLTLTVQATCAQKGHLLELARSKARFPVWVTNKSIGERFGGNEAMIKSYPELSLGAEAEDREFEIQVMGGIVEVV